jgi:hypothetical protein
MSCERERLVAPFQMKAIKMPMRLRGLETKER